MSNYKLYYYNLRGRAELSRLILYYSGIPFEDIRLEKSEWPLYKSGNVPWNICTFQSE